MIDDFDKLGEEPIEDGNEFELMPIYIQDILNNNRKFSVHNPPPNIQWLLKRTNPDGKSVGIASRGEVVVFYGPPKSRKSTALNCVTASAFSDDPDRTLKFELDLLPDDEILYFDTEMALTAFHRRQMKLNKMCGYGGTQDIPSLHAYSLKPYNYRERLKQIEFFIKKHIDTVAVIVIDQIADLVGDINDRAQTSHLINRIEYWTEISQAMLVTSIHASRGSEDMTGVTGSELAKKMDSGFYMEKIRTTKQTKVVHLLSREEDVNDFFFDHNEYGYPVLIDDSKDDF